MHISVGCGILTIADVCVFLSGPTMAVSKKWLVNFQRYIALILNRLFFLIFYGKGATIPAIPNSASILKCSATELARRIRCQEVSSEQNALRTHHPLTKPMHFARS